MPPKIRAAHIRLLALDVDDSLSARGKWPSAESGYT